MKVTVADFAKDLMVYNITGCTKEELENRLNLFFSSEGYTLKSSAGDVYTYTKGNRVMRILFGAFVKYHKQTATIKTDGNLFSVMLHKDSTGMSGGLIGMNQVKKEFTRLCEAFKAYFAN